MALPLENWLGLAGSALLLVAPARDQLLRFRSMLANRRAVPGRGDTARFWRMIAARYAADRNGWNALDSLCMAAGAILLGLSYLLG